MSLTLAYVPSLVYTKSNHVSYHYLLSAEGLEFSRPGHVEIRYSFSELYFEKRKYNTSFGFVYMV